MNRIQLLLTPEHEGEPSTHLLTHPMLDDFMIEAQTEFTSYADLAPTISSLTDLANTFSTGSGGTVTKGGFELRQVLDMQRWTKTSPVRITTQLLFYTKTDAEKDVVDQVNQLWGLHLPKFVNKQIRVPGMNAQNANKIEEAYKTLTKEDKETFDETHGKDFAKKTKGLQYNSLFAVIIPGVVYIPYAFLNNCRPTYSKQTTKRGFPLWATVEVEIQGISAAFWHNFTQGKNFYYSRGLRSIESGEFADVARNIEA